MLSSWLHMKRHSKRIFRVSDRGRNEDPRLFFETSQARSFLNDHLNCLRVMLIRAPTFSAAAPVIFTISCLNSR